MGCGAGTASCDKLASESVPEAESAAQPYSSTGIAWQDGGASASRSTPWPPHRLDDEDSMDLTLESVCGPTVMPGGATACNTPLRILLVRHALSKGSHGGLCADPELSKLGVQQADRLGTWLRFELEGSLPHGVMFVSSPMRRCLCTILPAVLALNLSAESCVCHGSAYELACAGTTMPGSNPQDLEHEFPVRCVGFHSNGWDYQGQSPIETKSELLYRVRRLIWWLETEAFNFPALKGQPDVDNPVLVLCMHETILDLIIRILVDDEAIPAYDGKVKHKMKNSYITELSRSVAGTLTVTRRDSGDHMRFAVQPLIA